MSSNVSNSRRRPALVRTARRAGAGLALLCLVIAAAEVFIRAKRPQWGRSAIVEIALNDDYNHTLRPHHEQVVQYQDMVLERHYNSWGMDEPAEPEVPKPPGVFRVLVMGDSFMQSPSPEDSVAGALRRRLAGSRTADGRRVEVLNGGQSSYSALLHLARFKHQYRRLEPDAVILAPDLTDVFDDACRYRMIAVRDAGGALLRVGKSPAARRYHELLAAGGYYSVPLSSYRVLLEALVLLWLGDETDRADETNDACREIFAHAKAPRDALSVDARSALAFSLAALDSLFAEIGVGGRHLFVFAYPHEGQLTGLLNRAYEFGTERLCRERGVPFRSFFNVMSSRYVQGLKIYADGDMHYNTDGYRFLASDVANFVAADPRQALGVDLK